MMRPAVLAMPAWAHGEPQCCEAGDREGQYDELPFASHDQALVFSVVVSLGAGSCQLPQR